MNSIRYRVIPVFAILALLVMGSVQDFAQVEPRGPLGAQKFIRKPQQLAKFTRPLWGYDISAQRVYSLRNFPGRGDSLVAGPQLGRSDSVGLTGQELMDQITGNFAGNSLDEVAAAWETGNRSVALAVSRVNPVTNELIDLSLTVSDSLSLADIPPDSLWMVDYYNYRRIRLEAGQFDADPEEEFILAYWAADSTVRLELYDEDSGFARPRAFISNEKLSTRLPILKDPQSGHEQPFFDIAVADFDQDGMGEIILVGKAPDIVQSNKMFAAVYDYDPLTSAFSAKAKADVPHRISGTGDDGNFRFLTMIAGRMNRDNTCDGLISLSLGGFSNSDPENHAQVAFRVSDDLAAITFGPAQDLGPFYAVSAADINSDDIVEGIATKNGSLSGHGTLKILTVDAALTIHSVPAAGSVPSLYYFSRCRRTALAANIDTDTTASNWLPELITSEEYFGISRIYVYNVVLDSVNNVTALQLRNWYDAPNDEGDLMALVAGNFEGGAIHLGTPAHASKTDILQPIVILNAPPVHFDVFDGVTYDVSKSYEPNTPRFYSRYVKKSQNSVEVQTKVSSCWATSVSFGGGISYYGVGVNLDFERRYGKNFSKLDGSSKTVTIGVQVDAKEDDAIYATVVDYDIWEYPVLAEDSLVGHILVLDPMQITNRWFPSKSWSAGSYVPNHEVGNILSYQRYPSLINNEEVAFLISGTYDQSYTLHSSSSYDWSLIAQDFATSQAETERRIGFGVNVGDMFGFTIGGSESYDETSVSTHTTSVTQDLVLSTHLDAIDLGIGEVRYTVTPYSYWAKNGALVIDYAVLPDLAPPGFSPTWWQRRYDSIPDPAFILPWRLDPEKGFALEDEVKRYQTNEIVFSDYSPEPGDTIAIRARLHNFSLSPTVGPVNTRFYVGDPDSGGVLITGIHGETELQTSTLIASRGIATVQMQWQVPVDLPQFPKIYAVIDPQNEVTEIHEENNKGWTVLGKQTIVAVEEPPARIVPAEFRLHQNYPNPFNPTTTIAFDLSRAVSVRIVVFDVLGREVARLLDERMQGGSYRVKFNAAGLAGGVYFYRLQAGSYVETRKLLLVR